MTLIDGTEELYPAYQPIVVHYLPSVLNKEGGPYQVNPNVSKYTLKIVSYSTSRDSNYQGIPESTYLVINPGVPLRFYLMANEPGENYQVFYYKDKLLQAEQLWWVPTISELEVKQRLEVELDQTKRVKLPKDFFNLVSLTPSVKYKIGYSSITIEGEIGVKYVLEYKKGLNLGDIVVINKK